MNDSFKNLDYSKFKTYSCKERVSKVNCKDFSRPWEKGGSFSIFLDKLPSILAGNDIRYIIKAISCAAKKKKTSLLCHGRTHHKNRNVSDYHRLDEKKRIHPDSHERGRHYPRP